MERVSEITFNASLLAEFRAIDFVNRLLDQGRLPHGIGARASTAASTCTASRSNSTFKKLDRRLEAQFGFRLLPDAAQGRPPRGAEFPHRAFRRHRRALDGRSRRRGEGRVGVTSSLPAKRGAVSERTRGRAIGARRA